jgi:hypothetical protein
VNATVTKSLSEKAKLRAYVEGILGRRLADAETKNCDIVALVGGRPCLLNVEHNESGGNVYANIKSVSPLPKAMKAPTPVGTLVTYSPDEHDEATWEKLPRFLKEKIGKRIEDEAPKKITPAEDAARSMDFWGLAKEPPATDEGVPYNDEIPH